MNNENMWTQGKEHHTLRSVRGVGEGQHKEGRVGRDNVARNVGYR